MRLRKLVMLLILVIVSLSAISCGKSKPIEIKEKTFDPEVLKAGNPATFDCVCIAPEDAKAIVIEATRKCPK
jgi:hypothetical protein